MDTFGAFVEFILYAVLAGAWAGAVGDLIADSDIMEPLKWRVTNAYGVNSFIARLLDCRFCVSAWAVPPALALVCVADTSWFWAMVLCAGLAWKFSTILRGINE